MIASVFFIFMIVLFVRMYYKEKTIMVDDNKIDSTTVSSLPAALRHSEVKTSKIMTDTSARPTSMTATTLRLPKI